MIRRGFPYLEPRTEPAPAEAQQLEREGYAIVRGLLSQDEVAELHDEIAGVFEREPPDERGKRPPEDAQMFRYAMLNRSAAAQAAVAHPRLLSVIEPLLGEDCHVIANTAWRNPAGQPGSHGGQNWHIDAGPHIPLPEGVRWPAEIPSSPAATSPAARRRAVGTWTTTWTTKGGRSCLSLCGQATRACSSRTYGTGACRPATATMAGSSSRSTTGGAISPSAC